MTSFRMLFFFNARRVSASSSGLSSTRSMTLLLMILSSYHQSSLQCKIKRRALLDCPFRPYLSAMSVDNALHRGEAHAGPRELACGMKALERSEQTIRVSGVKTGAVITHKKRALAVP